MSLFLVSKAGSVLASMVLTIGKLRIPDISHRFQAKLTWRQITTRPPLALPRTVEQNHATKMSQTRLLAGFTNNLWPDFGYAAKKYVAKSVTIFLALLRRKCL